jgi:hypothetical protein
VGRRWAIAALVAALAPGCDGCSQRAAAPATTPAKSELCQLVTATLLPPDAQHIGPGRWSVGVGVGDKVLAAHGARFAKRKIEPNGQAWAGLLEQCVTAATLHGVHLDPEAGSLHAWVESDADKDRYVAAVCRALDDTSWLERCIASVDRDRLDD